MKVFFALFLICGFIVEASYFRGSKYPLWFQTVYLIGAVWFLFWKEPYILHGFMEALMMLSFTKAQLQYTLLWKLSYQFVDSILSLVLICLMGFHFLVVLFLR